MTKSAVAWSTGHALNIYSNPTTPLSIHTSKEDSAALQLPNERKQPTFFDGTYFSSISQLQYGDRLKITFEVAESYRKDFILIKGLLEFHRLSDFTFTYNRVEGTLDVTLSITKQEELLRFLRKVSVWIGQEFSFKQHLRQMISFERDYRKKLASIYAGGDGFTLVRTY